MEGYLYWVLQLIWGQHGCKLSSGKKYSYEIRSQLMILPLAFMEKDKVTNYHCLVDENCINKVPEDHIMELTFEH